jgi:malonyl CoA-acyl carrier protein transacylase
MSVGIDKSDVDPLSTNLVEVLQFRTEERPDAFAFTFLRDGDGDEENLSFEELNRQARLIGAWLQQHEATAQRVLLLYPPGIHFITAFFGCLYAGAVAVPAYPPRKNDKLLRLQTIATDARPTHVLTNTATIRQLKAQAEELDGLKNLQWLDTEELLSGSGSEALISIWRAPVIDSHTLAFLQYTSGSTGQPKGVMISHGNLIHNQRQIKTAFRVPEHDRVVGWLPLYHDMGLIGNVLHSLFTGSRAILMSPMAFIQRPVRWLEAITRYKPFVSGGPSFAYDLCTRKVTAAQRATLDLSSWRVAFNGAEPIRADVLQRFAEMFAPCGFRRDAFHPCYGLAETTLLASGRPASGPPITQTILSEPLEQRRVVQASDAETNQRTFVGCGESLGGQQLKIVDPETLEECAPDAIGEIWVRGGSVAQGYWNKPEETAETFQARLASNGEGPFLRTGDLGFLSNGELFVTGRLKDLIIINGRNHYPQDIERTIEQSYAGIRQGGVAAFAVEIEGEERLVTVQEIERGYLRTLNVAEVEAVIRDAVSVNHELELHAIVLVKPGSIPKTTSGKLQRRLCSKMFLAGEFVPLANSIVQPLAPQDQGIQFSLLYFSSNEADFTDNKYELLVEGAKFADQHDFTAVWIPERHFHAFGGLYPNPSVLGSALAMITQRIRIRAGSVVLPLQNPIRVAEEWSVVDNLSRGRVDLAFARGWNPNDFVLAPQNYSNSTEILFNELQTIRRLWQGETIKLPNGVGAETEIRIHPLPKQPELRCWITCSGGAERFVEAGASGANVLTALLFQSIDELAVKIAAYREARAKHGHDPNSGHVTLMMHTFIDNDLEAVRQTVKAPFIDYLKTSVTLWRHGSKDLKDLNEKQQEELLEFAFERYFQTSALFGTPTGCLETVKRLKDVGVDEIACLMDFGIETKRVLLSLEALNELRIAANRKRQQAEEVTAPAPSPVLVNEATEDRELVRWLQGIIVTHLAESLEIDAQKVPLDKNFYSLGVSSLKAVEIMNALAEHLAVSLSPTVLFEAPTVPMLASYFARTHAETLRARMQNGLRIEVQERQTKLATEQRPVKITERIERDTDVAVIGMSCRFPQAPTLDAFWELLRDGKDAITEVPSDHWDWRLFYDSDQSNGKKTYSRWGGFLTDLDQFDPFFFNISHREARLMDPQQRIFLEVSWETFEHAGYSRESLANKQVGVFVGSSNNGYYHRIEHALTAADHAAGVGNQNAIIANRVSFNLNLRGPSILVDTMCSSSLVAVHLALQSLHQGDCEVALAGGVNVLLSPEYYVAMSRMKAHAPDGHCKTFDHRADGIVFGEGAGAVLLKPLNAALRDGDAIYAVIKGSAINHGGQTNGLTAPNPEAHAQLITGALERSGVNANSISYLEAHGTGTSLGDPIEIEGASRAFSRHMDRKQFCAIGSVKTNIGHLEPAAGISGLIKIVLSMQHQQLPPTLNFEKPNPIINFEDSPFHVNTELRPWDAPSPRRAAISSFGIGGSNAHVVLEEAPSVKANVNEYERSQHVLTLSAKSEKALRELAVRYATFILDHPDVSLPNVCYTANTGRSHFTHRLACSAETRERLIEQLQAFAAGQKADGLHHGQTQAGHQPRLAFLFTGQGSQAAGMGQELYLSQPTFRNALQRCDRELRQYLEQPLLSVLYPEDDQSAELHQTAYAQPALFALEYALLTLWRSWGVTPEAVIGHSVGEYAAACAAGVFSLEEGLRMIAGRGRLMQSLPGGGGMAAVFASEPNVRQAIAACGNDVSVAAINAPEQVVISGRYERVEQLLGHFEERGVRTQRLQVSHAFHSSLMQPILDQFEQEAQQILFQQPSVPWISSLTGGLLQNGEKLNASYWSRQLRETVRFATGIEALAQQGCSVFLEIGPSPILLGMAATTLAQENLTLLPSLRTGRGDWQQLLDSLCALYVTGVEIDWKSFCGDYGRQRVALPTYPFERERCWIDPLPEKETGYSTSVQSAEDLPKWFYEIQWRHQERHDDPAQESPAQSGSWIILADTKGVGRALADRLEARGEHCFVVDSATGEDFDQHLAEYSFDTCRGIVHLHSLDSGSNESLTVASLEEAQRLGCANLIRLVQTLEKRTDDSPRLWIVTEGALSVGPHGDASSIAQSTIWGMGRVMSLERPQCWGGLIDLEPHTPATDQAAAILDQITFPDHEDQVAFREGQRFVPRLVEYEPKATNSFTLRSDATYLITGGLGSLGLEVARWMVEQGARHIALVSRRKAKAPVEVLSSMGASVTVVSADIADEARMTSLINELTPPLRGIVHAAGVQTRQSISEMSLEQLNDVMRPKVAGSWVLHKVTANIELDFLISFSSLSSVIGSVDLAHYAAANQFVDSLAQHRRAHGKVALSVNWGPWAGDGMVTSEIGDLFEKLGVKPLARNRAVQALATLAQSDSPQVTVADIDWQTFKPIYELRRPRPLVEEIVVEPAILEDAQPAGSSKLALELAAATESESARLLRAHIGGEVASILGQDLTRLPLKNAGFFEMGMDSLMAMELKRRLESSLGCSLASTLTFDYPNIDALVDHILTNVLALNGKTHSTEWLRSQTAEQVLSTVEDLSDEEALILLEEKLQMLEGNV